MTVKESRELFEEMSRINGSLPLSAAGRRRMEERMGGGMVIFKNRTNTKPEKRTEEPPQNEQ